MDERKRSEILSYERAYIKNGRRSEPMLKSNRSKNNTNAIANSPCYDFSSKVSRRLLSRAEYHFACAYGSYSFTVWCICLWIYPVDTHTHTHSLLIVDLRVRLYILRNIFIYPIRHLYMATMHTAHCTKTIFHRLIKHTVFVSVHNFFPFCLCYLLLLFSVNESLVERR